MKKSPVYPKYETSAFGGDGIFDPHVDFSQFLEEARHHQGRVVDFHSSPLYPEEKGKKRLPEDKQAGKKSWKNHLFSWWKTDKKSEPRGKSTSSSPYMNSLPKRHLVSGPIHGSGKTKNYDGRHRRPASGPLTGLFNPTIKRVENEIPYMCLDELDRPQALQTYGPVYLVT